MNLKKDFLEIKQKLYILTKNHDTTTGGLAQGSALA